MKLRKQLVTIVTFLFVTVCSLCVGNKANAADTTMVENVMNVKCQVTEGTDANTNTPVNLRLVTSVDSLNYSEIGFKIYYNGTDNPSTATPIPVKVDTVFKRIVASAESGVDYNYNPKVISTDAEYFATVTLLDIAPANFDKPFYIKPYCRTLDGQTIYGVSRYVKVSDSYNDIVNVQVKATAEQANGMQVDIDDNNEAKLTAGTAYEHDGTYAHLTFKVNDGQELSSVTKFTITGSAGENIDTFYHRNLLTEYTGGTTYDTSWYNTNTSANKFVIVTAADLYGLVETAKTFNYNNRTIYLGADITVNDGAAKDWSANNKPAYEWTTGIGIDLWFGGTFDGCGDTISGLYTCTSNSYVGLFGRTNIYGTIKNLRLENSYFEYNKGSGEAHIGSVVGNCQGSINTVYSDAIVVSNGSVTGGLIGMLTGNVEHLLQKCWFGGTVTSNKQYLGGLVGAIANINSAVEVTITDCLNTGSVTSNYTGLNSSGDFIPYVGGFVGSYHAQSTHTKEQKLKIENSLNVGSVTVTAVEGKAINAVGPMIGRAIRPVTFEGGVYTTEAVTVSGNGTVNTANSVPGVGNHTTNQTTVNGQANVVTAESIDTITGLQALNLPFDFADIWVATTSGYPQLKQFATTNAIPADTSWYEEASATQKYTITTMEELYGLAVLAQSNVFTGWEFKLGNDITVNSGESDGWATDAPKYMWLPIGSASRSFNGTFDGQGHTIKGIYLKTDATRVGLFGQVNTAQIKNLSLKNSYIESTYDETTNSAESSVGSIAGYATKATLESVYSNATVVCPKVIDGGGLLGRANTKEHTMTNCWFDGRMEGYKNTGGLVGTVIQGTMQMTNCLNTGIVTSDYTSTELNLGGFCGRLMNSATITFVDCLNASDIQVKYGQYVGSYVGYTSHISQKTIFSNSYSIEKFTVLSDGVTVEQKVAGLGGTAYGPATGTLNVVSIDDLKGTKGYCNANLNFYVEGKAETDADVWVARANEVPALKAFVAKTEWLPLASIVRPIFIGEPDTGWLSKNAGTEEDPYIISTPEELYGFAQESATNPFTGKFIKLANDIVVNSGEAKNYASNAPRNIWTQIAPNQANAFAGTFDGDGHTISGLYLASTGQAVGLFGETAVGSTVKNLCLENSYFSTSYTDVARIGSIAGRGEGNLNTIYSNAIVVSSGQCTGGIVGAMNASGAKVIENCWFTGSVTSSAVYTGGILGYASAGSITLRNCLNTGTITSTVTDSYSADHGRVGGLIGHLTKGTSPVKFIGCLNTGNVITHGTLKAATLIGCSRATLEFTHTYTLDTVSTTASSTINFTSGEKPSVGTYSSNGTTWTGLPILKNNDEMKGAEAYRNLALEFWTKEGDTGAWVTVDGGYPVLKSFVDKAEWNKGVNLNLQPVHTDWYNAYKSDTTYIIRTAADLYGLSALVKEGNNFAGKTIQIASDVDGIVVNEGRTGDDRIKWTPVGNAITPFAGTFDGNLKTISGVYCKSDKINVGLFGQTADGSKIQNLSLADSYFECTLDAEEAPDGLVCVGSVVGYSHSNLKNVYSKSTVKAYGMEVGGLVGSVNNISTATPDPESILTSKSTRTYEGCWFDGSIISDHQRVGGIVGGLRQGGLSFKDCLYTGTMTLSCADTDNGTRAGGILGYAQNTSTKVIFNGIISVGTINNTTGNGNIGTIIGRVSGVNEGVSLTNVYATPGDFYGSSATTITDTVKEVQADDRLIGYTDYLNGTGLDFDSVWTLRKTGVPALKIFVPSDEVYTYTDDALALTYWGDTVGEAVSLSSAKDMGTSNYVITLTDNNNYYTTYEGELVEAGFTKKVSNDTDEDALASKGVYNAVYTKTDGGVNWVLNLTHAGNSKKETYISVTTGRTASEVLSPHMQKDKENTYNADDGYTTSGKVITLRMNKGDTQNGDMNINGFVIQLPNGHFIINDGGTYYDCKALVDYLCSVSNGKKPIIEAWTISHFHADHANVFLEFINNPSYVEQIYVEAIYVNEPNAESIALETNDVAPIIKNVRKAIPLLKATGNQSTKVYRYQTGQRFYFDGVTMDVVQAQEQIPVSTYDEAFTVWPKEKHGQFNTTSTGLMFTIDDGTASGKKVYIGGDQTWVNQEWMMAAYDASLFTDVNVFTMFHHGANTMEDFTKWSTNDYAHKFDVVLYPRNEEPGGYVYERYSSSMTNASKDGLSSIYSYANGSVLLTFNESGIKVEQ